MEIQNGAVANSYMTIGLLTFPHILGSPSAYMTLQLLHSEFPYIWGKFDFLFLSVLHHGWVQVKFTHSFCWGGCRGVAVKIPKISSWLNVHKKVAVASLSTLCDSRSAPMPSGSVHGCFRIGTDMGVISFSRGGLGNVILLLCKRCCPVNYFSPSDCTLEKNMVYGTLSWSWLQLTLSHSQLNSVVSYPPPLQRGRGGVGKMVEHICICLLISKTSNRKRESIDKGRKRWALPLCLWIDILWSIGIGQPPAWADFNFTP